MSKLAGLRVLDLSRVLSGPFCTALLADLGAEVIKIESPGSGDDSRRFGPFVNGQSVYFALINRNKKSVTLNLKNERAKAMLLDLASQCDVVVENFRPGVAKRLGIDYPVLAKANPRLVYLSITGFGQTGPKASWPAYDLIIQAMSGIMSITGEADGPPTALGESLGDLWTGLFGSWAVLAALQSRERTGRGDYIDLAMFDSMLAMQVTGLSQLFASGQAPKRVGNRHPVTTPVDTFKTRDGLIALVVPSDAQFRKLCELMGAPELAEDARFRDNLSRRINQGELRQAVEAWTQRATTEELLTRLLAADIPVGPVWDLEQALHSDQADDRQMVRQVTHRAFGSIGIASQPAKFKDSSPTGVEPEPGLGQHTEEVLVSMLGFSASEVARFREEGLI